MPGSTVPGGGVEGMGRDGERELMRENLIPPSEAAEIVKFQPDHGEPAVDGNSQPASAGNESFCVVGVREEQLRKDRGAREYRPLRCPAGSDHVMLRDLSQAIQHQA